ncbi:MAG: DUF805 domain-containing protein [Pseudomonadota bacterium]
MDDIKLAVTTCFNKYTDFKGRAARPEFWWFALFQFVVLAILGMLHNFLYAIGVLAMLLPALAVGARRFHDIGKSGWFLLLGLIPFVGWLILIYFFVQPSGPANEWGQPQGPVEAGPPMAPGQQ